MIEQERQPSSTAERGDGVGDRRRAPEDSSPLLGVRVELDSSIGVGETKGGDLNRLLALLVALTLACGVAAGVTVNLAPPHADESGDGY
jgi:hypothetical protein